MRGKRNGRRRGMAWVLVACLLFAGGAVLPEGILVPARASAAGPGPYMVYFDSLGGSDCGYLTNVPENSTIQALPVPVREGFIFDGWYMDTQFVEQFTVFTPVTDNLVLYAKWEEKFISYITATYVGEPVILKRRPEKDDFVVQAHYYDGTSKVVTDFSLFDDVIELIGENEVMVMYQDYSVYVPVKGIEEPLYYVIFDSQGGSSVKPVTGIHANAHVELPVEPVREDYIFDGWYTDKTYKVEFTNTTSITKSLIVYAKWEPEAPAVPDVAYALNTKRLNLRLNETGSVFVPSLDPNLDVYYECANEKVAEVNEHGIVQGKKDGRTTVIVYVEDGTVLKCKVGVGSKQYITKIKTNVSAKRVRKGKTFQVKATVSPSGASKKGLSYKSSNKAVATVSSSGLVRAKKKGVTYITVRSTDGTDVKKRVKIRVI